MAMPGLLGEAGGEVGVRRGCLSLVVMGALVGKECFQAVAKRRVVVKGYSRESREAEDC